MKSFLVHVGELVAAHVVATLILATVGVVVVAKLWTPAMRYFQNRRWLKRAVLVGIHNFFPSRESYAVDRPLAFSDYIESARNSLRYFGHWLAFTVEQHHMLDTLCSMATAGKSVQLVLLDPDISGEILAAYARYLGEDPEALQTQIQTAWTRVRQAKSELGTNSQDKFQLRRHSEFIPYSAFWFDKEHDGQHILVDMKLYGASRRDAYGIELHPVKRSTSRYPSLYERYASSLTRLEDRSSAD